MSTELVAIPATGVDRATYLGSADIPSIFGCEDAFSSPYEVWARKRRIIPPAELNEAMAVGLVLEGYILQRYAREENAKIAAQQVFYRHPDWDFLGCTVDGLVFADGQPIRIVEAKTTRDWSWDTIPLRYEAQVQWQMGISGIHQADLTVLHRPDLKLQTYRVEFNPAIYQALEDRAIDFWFAYVQANVAPDPDHLKATTEALKHIKAQTGKQVDIDHLAERLEALKVIKAEIKDAESKKELIENEIRLALNDAEIGLINGKPAYSWKTQSRTTIDTKRLKAEKPEIAEQYQVTSESRVLRELKAK